MLLMSPKAGSLVTAIRSATAWVSFYNAPLGRAPQIASGDYLEYLKVH